MIAYLERMLGLGLIRAKIPGGAQQTEVVVAGEYQNVVWATAALGAEGGFLLFFFIAIHLFALQILLIYNEIKMKIWEVPKLLSIYIIWAVIILVFLYCKVSVV